MRPHKQWDWCSNCSFIYGECGQRPLVLYESLVIYIEKCPLQRKGTEGGLGELLHSCDGASVTMGSMAQMWLWRWAFINAGGCGRKPPASLFHTIWLFPLRGSSMLKHFSPTIGSQQRRQYLIYTAWGLPAAWEHKQWSTHFLINKYILCLSISPSKICWISPVARVLTNWKSPAFCESFQMQQATNEEGFSYNPALLSVITRYLSSVARYNFPTRASQDICGHWTGVCRSVKHGVNRKAMKANHNSIKHIA